MNLKQNAKNKRPSLSPGQWVLTLVISLGVGLPLFALLDWILIHHFLSHHTPATDGLRVGIAVMPVFLIYEILLRWFTDRNRA